MHQSSLLVNAGDAAGFIEQSVVEVECRSHMYQYALVMHIIARGEVDGGSGAHGVEVFAQPEDEEDQGFVGR